MRDVPELIDGYRKFLEGRYRLEAALYQALAEKGQSPKTMIIACCDSRVSPATVFNAGPGELFVVRNVANLVPPCTAQGAPPDTHHGTSAALEYAVTELKVETVLVLGHARCGGVRAFRDGAVEGAAQEGFIGTWLSLLDDVGAETLRSMGDAPAEVQAQALEHAGIRQSLRNLATFPFVQARLDAGELRLRGAYFDIADGRLYALDPESGEFAPVG